MWVGEGWLTVSATQNVDDLGYFFALLSLVAAGYSVFNTVAYMIAEDFLFGAAERGADRRNLGYDIDAVTVFFHHAE